MDGADGWGTGFDSTGALGAAALELGKTLDGVAFMARGLGGAGGASDEADAEEEDVACSTRLTVGSSSLLRAPDAASPTTPLVADTADGDRAELPGAAPTTTPRSGGCAEMNTPIPIAATHAPPSISARSRTLQGGTTGAGTVTCVG